jgi:hypothetical protein
VFLTDKCVEVLRAETFGKGLMHHDLKLCDKGTNSVAGAVVNLPHANKENQFDFYCRLSYCRFLAASVYHGHGDVVVLLVGNAV